MAFAAKLPGTVLAVDVAVQYVRFVALDRGYVAAALAAAAGRASGATAGPLPPLFPPRPPPMDAPPVHPKPNEAIQRFTVQVGDRQLQLTAQRAGDKVDFRVEGQLPPGFQWETLVTELAPVVEYRGQRVQQLIAAGLVVTMKAGNASFSLVAEDSSNTANTVEKAMDKHMDQPVDKHVKKHPDA